MRIMTADDAVTQDQTYLVKAGQGMGGIGKLGHGCDGGRER
jgi:hypothetical protein